MATHTSILAWRIHCPLQRQLDPLEEGMATHPSILAWRRQLFFTSILYVLPEIVCIETRTYIYIYVDVNTYTPFYVTNGSL